MTAVAKCPNGPKSYLCPNRTNVSAPVMPRDPKRTIAIKYAFWNKWAGTKPVEVERTKGYYEGPWSVGKVTPAGLDNGITKVVK